MDAYIADLVGIFQEVRIRFSAPDPFSTNFADGAYLGGSHTAKSTPSPFMVCAVLIYRK